MKFNTKAIHAGQEPEKTSGAVMPPIFQTSTYAQKAPNVHQGYDYARVGNPTRTALEKMIAGLEEADSCSCFASGVAAIDAILKTLRPGDHVVSTNDLYGGTYRLFRQVFEPYGIEFSFIDMTDIDEVKSAIKDSTKLVWIETPTNPLLRVIDIAKVAKISSDAGALSVVDNTFASPYLQQPLLLGADVTMHSTTKYLGGHSDIIGGAVASSNEEFMEKIRFQVKTSGAVPGPMDCYLVLRGIKTLHLRVQRSVENAKQVVDLLESHPKVEKVYYPGLKSHAQHHIAAKQMNDFGAMVSFTLKDDTIEKANEVMSNTEIFTLAESLGGVESLISHPASMTHGSIPREVRLKAGLTDSLIRLSLGVEDAEDLISDLKQAIES
ncbi:cystathionine gamma-synthase [Rhodohalobacter sulfatireducens]|uniref:Cystathionine gamma-synthase n=1 Tax=Rhodohalobacter sulfatireducens TaxID=2911366 RepID=A0ABS9KH42_9BACT|nr:cystathionine gamma-synthase [Rhodohalobacter sulfatireducens]MCG2590174.1 cystathionine gamma-synthase [Rhodohalobacter sulfatireducens]